MNDADIGVLRVYLNPSEIAREGDPLAGYPWAWFRETWLVEYPGETSFMTHLPPSQLAQRDAMVTHVLPIKDLIRERDGHRCLRCGHPYRKGEHGNGEWSPCDLSCTHGAPVRVWSEFGRSGNPELGPRVMDVNVQDELDGGFEVDAQWRILTVHHLNGIKHDCRWWNLVSLCQRCHLTIQAKVYMDRTYDREHSEWFKPFAAGFYAWKYLDLELTQAETLARLGELLDLEQRQDALFATERRRL